MNNLLKNAALFAICVFICVSSAFSQVTVNSTQVCLGKATSLNGIYAPNNNLVSQWFWDLNNDGLFREDSGRVIGNVFPQSDTNWVGLKVRLNTGGFDSVLIPVIINPVPNVNFQVNNNCEFDAAEFVDQSSISSGSISQYLWDFNNDDVVDDNSGPNVSFTVGPATSFVSKLTCVSDLGCSSFSTKTTKVFARPVASFSTNDVCLGNDALFDNKSFINGGIISFNLWDFGDSILEVSGDDIAHNYAEAGTYNASLIVISGDNCRDTANATVTVNPLPDVRLEHSPDSAIINGEAVTLSVSGNASTYLWSTGENDNSITVSDSGNYNVLVNNDIGCSISLETRINLIKNLITINEIITPNRDGFNDFMKVDNIETIGPCTISIYNRWNDLVFSTSDYQNDWEGTYEGSPLDAGTYFYTIECNDKSQVGSINILR